MERCDCYLEVWDVDVSMFGCVRLAGTTFGCYRWWVEWVSGVYIATIDTGVVDKSCSCCLSSS